jgi:tripartite ATP-independent transporter DctM subunit
MTAVATPAAHPVPGPVRWLDHAVDAVVGVALVGELLIVIGNVLGRLFFNEPLLWGDEAAGFALSIIAFLGGAIAYRRDAHVRVQTIVALLPARWAVTMTALVDALVLGIAAVTGWQSVGLLVFRWHETTPILGLSASWIALPLTTASLVLALYAIHRLAGQPARALLGAVGILAGAGALYAGVLALIGHAPSTSAALGTALVAVLATVLLGLPIAFALMLGTIVFLHSGGTVALVALPQNMVDGTGRFVLLALPFFIFAGIVMERGGISRRLVSFVAALVGGIRGGLLQVMVVSMYIVSGISGSKAADVAAVGLVMRDMLEKEEYDLDQSAALLAASAAMGECIPPSLAMLVLGSVTSLSVAALFAGGLIPAAVIALCLMLLIWFMSPRRTRAPRTVRLGRLALGAVIPFSMPVFLFAGILLGFATPTEVSAFAVAYGLFIAVALYRETGPRDFARMVAEAATASGMVLFTLAAAQSFSWVLSAAELPHRLAEIVTTWANGPALFLLVSVIALIVLGSLLEGLPAILILAPLLVPLAPQAGVDPLHYGIVLLVAMGIGAFLPPLGVGFYIACSVVRAHADRATRAMIPYFAVLLIGVMLVAYVPWFTLSLPHMLHLIR